MSSIKALLSTSKYQIGLLAALQAKSSRRSSRAFMETPPDSRMYQGQFEKPIKIRLHEDNQESRELANLS